MNGASAPFRPSPRDLNRFVGNLLKKAGNWEEVPRSALLVRQGEVTPSGFFVRRGILGWKGQNGEGRQGLVAWYRGPACAAIVEAISGLRATADLVTLTACELVRIPRERIQRLLQETPDAAWMLIAYLAAELLQLQERVLDLLVLSAEERFLKLLRTDALPSRRGSRCLPRRVQLPLSQAQVAEWLGVSPQYLCRLLARLEQQAQFSRRRGWFLLPPVEGDSVKFSPTALFAKNRQELAGSSGP